MEGIDNPLKCLLVCLGIMNISNVGIVKLIANLLAGIISTWWSNWQVASWEQEHLLS